MFGKDTTKGGKDSFVIHPVSSSFPPFGIQKWSNDRDLSFVPNSKAGSMAVNISICTRKRNGCFLSVVLCITDYSCNLYLKNTNYSWLSADGASDYKPASRLWIVVFQQWNRVPELLRGCKKMESGQSIPHGACDKYFDLKKLRWVFWC